ncbi:hypothetical protein [Pontibacillus salipaludis]|uniref:hypothetical protein n=1 Tax=Pontibacillus salipaludis TaxID=1697394 RepID=UPI0031EA8EFA
MPRIRIFEPHWMKPFHDLNKHMDLKESWFQFPEKKKTKFDQQFQSFHTSHDEWHKSFQEGINEIEKAMNELEKKMEG